MIKWTTLDLEIIGSGEYTALELSEIFEVDLEKIYEVAKRYKLEFRKVRARWSAEEIEKLIKMLDKRYTKNQICKVLDKSIFSVNRKLRELRGNSFKWWEEWEVETLIHYHDKMTYQDIAKLLGRSRNSIKNKIVRLKEKGVKFREKTNIGNPAFGREIWR